MKTTTSRMFICVALLGAHLLSGCASWQPARMSPTTLNDAGNPNKVRIRQTDGSTFVLYSPTMVSDTLTGQVDAQPRRIPLALVSEMAVRTVTFVGFVVPVVAILVVFAGIQLRAMGCT